MSVSGDKVTKRMDGSLTQAERTALSNIRMLEIAITMRSSIGDVFTAAAFGLIGYLMHRFDYPRITLVIALVLSELMERNYTQFMLMFDGDWTGFFRDTSTLVLFLLTLVALSIPITQAIRKWRAIR